ncbi:MAG: hypothetical protein QOH66_1138 [Actinomycetota bacterium]|nr:hypothetical protein [Actinomycetota bacterium]
MAGAADEPPWRGHGPHGSSVIADEVPRPGATGCSRHGPAVVHLPAVGPLHGCPHHPPLHRWVAGHLLRRGPEGFSSHSIGLVRRRLPWLLRWSMACWTRSPPWAPAGRGPDRPRTRVAAWVRPASCASRSSRRKAMSRKRPGWRPAIPMPRCGTGGRGPLPRQPPIPPRMRASRTACSTAGMAERSAMFGLARSGGRLPSHLTPTSVIIDWNSGLKRNSTPLPPQTATS